MAAFTGQLSARTPVGTVPRRGPGEAATRRAAAARGGAGAPGARLGATAHVNEWTAVDSRRAAQQKRAQRALNQQELALRQRKLLQDELIRAGRARRVPGRVWRVPQGTVRPDEMCFLCRGRGHYAADCPNPPRVKPQQQQRQKLTSGGTSAVPAGSWAARARGKPHTIAEPASWLDTPWALRLLGETLCAKASTAEAEQAEFLALCEAAIGARVFLCVCPYGCPDPVNPYANLIPLIESTQ